ncbi:MAG: sodium/solute symporter [Gemmatimonadetes bacterium]|jgi:SSS family transporter|nr:sodium/solute symporter [Gemmatimonadota bacterium]MBT5146271.1 sodium/solute symporter [Gemmatimonadota bacterium]MBT5590775.1 sodium/solute symporter [Gemmatimonadota bacterium]MBT5963228.1 sodium/solute symporter [Gemmatimonadota bacterium]
MGTRLNAWCLFQVLLLGLGISATAAVAEVSVNIQSLPTLAAPVEGAFVGSDGEVLIVAGGESEEGLSAHVSVLAADGARWQTSRLEVPIAHGVTATTADGMICLGGVDRSGPTTRVMRLRWDGAALLQEPLPELPTPRLEAAAAVLDGILYVTGGRPAVDARPDGALLALDLSAPETGWQSLEPNPSPRLQPMLVARAGAIYLMGGTGDSSEQNWSYRAKPFDGTITRGWVQIAAAPADLSDAIPLATGQSHICVLTTGAGQSSPDLLVYHTITDTWVSKGTWAGAEKGARYAAWQGGVAVADTAGDTIRRIQIDSTPAALHWLDYTAIGFYLVVLLGIGAYFAHGDGTSAGFFLGGRRIPWWAAGISLYATGTSAISFMAIPTKTYVTNQVYGFGSLWSPIVWLPAAFIIIPLIRSLDLTSTYEYLERRFSLSVRLMGSVLCVAFQVGGRMSVILLLPAMALSAVTGLNVLVSVALMGVLATVYTAMGGIEAVIWTDVLQCVVLIGGGMLALGIIIFSLDGNWGAFVASSEEYGKLDGFLWGWDLTIPVFWIFALSSLLQLTTFPNDQVMVQRVLSTPDPRSARNAAIVLALIVVPGTILFHLLGSAMFAHFRDNPASLSPTMDNIHTLPLFIVQSMPPGVTGLVIAGLFAASMSSLDSSMSSTATVLVTDFYKRFKPQVTDAACLKLARWLTAGIGILGTVVALLMATLEIKSLYDLWMQLVALLGGGFAGVYALGMLTRRAHDTGAILGAITSVVVTVLVKAYTPLHFMLYGIISVGTCIIVGYLASLVLPGRRGDLKGLTVYTRIDSSEGVTQ